MAEGFNSAFKGLICMRASDITLQNNTLKWDIFVCDTELGVLS
jgi:hypothetical protein